MLVGDVYQIAELDLIHKTWYGLSVTEFSACTTRSKFDGDMQC